MKIDKQNFTDDEKIEWISEVLKCFSIARQKFGQLKNNPDAILYAWNILDSRDLLPEPIEIIKEIEKELVTPQQQREYRKWHYMQQKKMQAEKDKQKVIDMKIEHALKRKKNFCVTCQRMIPVISPTYELKLKKNDRRQRILVKSVCPICKSITIGWGGYMPEEKQT